MKKFKVIKVWTVTTTAVDAMNWLDTLGTEFSHQLFSNHDVKKSYGDCEFVVGFFKL